MKRKSQKKTKRDCGNDMSIREKQDTSCGVSSLCLQYQCLPVSVKVLVFKWQKSILTNNKNKTGGRDWGTLKEMGSYGTKVENKELHKRTGKKESKLRIQRRGSGHTIPTEINEFEPFLSLVLTSHSQDQSCKREHSLAELGLHIPSCQSWDHRNFLVLHISIEEQVPDIPSL